RAPDLWGRHWDGGHQPPHVQGAERCYRSVEGRPSGHPIVHEDHIPACQRGEWSALSVPLDPPFDLLLLALHLLLKLAGGYTEAQEDFGVEMAIAGFRQRPHRQLRISRRP